MLCCQLCSCSDWLLSRCLVSGAVLCKSWTICAIKFSHANRPQLTIRRPPPHRFLRSGLLSQDRWWSSWLCILSGHWLLLLLVPGLTSITLYRWQYSSIMALSGCSLFTPELLIAVKCPHLTSTVSPGGATAREKWRWSCFHAMNKMEVRAIKYQENSLFRYYSPNL